VESSGRKKVNKKEYSRIREKLLSRINEENHSAAKIRSQDKPSEGNSTASKHGNNEQNIGSSRPPQKQPSKHSEKDRHQAFLSDKTQALVRNTVFSRIHSEKEAPSTSNNVPKAKEDSNDSDMPPTPPPPPVAPNNQRVETAYQNKEIRWKGLSKHKMERKEDHLSGAHSVPPKMDHPSEEMTDAELNKLVMRYSEEVGSEASGQMQLKVTNTNADANGQVLSVPVNSSSEHATTGEKRKQLLQKFIDEKCEDVPQRMSSSIRKYSQDVSDLDNGDSQEGAEKTDTRRRNSAPSPEKSYTQFLTGQNRVLFSSAVPALPDGQAVADVLEKK
jgi:hypothetical protein